MNKEDQETVVWQSRMLIPQGFLNAGDYDIWVECSKVSFDDRKKSIRYQVRELIVKKL